MSRVVVSADDDLLRRHWSLFDDLLQKGLRIFGTCALGDSVEEPELLLCVVLDVVTTNGAKHSAICATLGLTPYYTRNYLLSPQRET